mmetsp:Transcript_12944/g.27341  ORF Transcript_12944/g.27341 Transcript_12944/m.27341 type:complete len:293 (-) Transcript_12944:3813-4691(-)
MNTFLTKTAMSTATTRKTVTMYQPLSGMRFSLWLSSSVRPSSDSLKSSESSSRSSSTVWQSLSSVSRSMQGESDSPSRSKSFTLFSSSRKSSGRMQIGHGTCTVCGTRTPHATVASLSSCSVTALPALAAYPNPLFTSSDPCACPCASVSNAVAAAPSASSADFCRMLSGPSRWIPSQVEASCTWMCPTVLGAAPVTFHASLIGLSPSCGLITGVRVTLPRRVPLKGSSLPSRTGARYALEFSVGARMPQRIGFWGGMPAAYTTKARPTLSSYDTPVCTEMESDAWPRLSAW